MNILNIYFFGISLKHRNSPLCITKGKENVVHFFIQISFVGQLNWEEMINRSSGEEMWMPLWLPITNKILASVYMEQSESQSHQADDRKWYI